MLIYCQETGIIITPCICYTRSMTLTPKHINDVAKTICTVDICIVSDDKILMLKRSESKKVFPNWLALPGGHIEENENPLHAAIREAYEETGVTIPPHDIQLKFVAIHHHTDRNEQYMVFGFLARIPTLPEQLVANDEGSLHWMDKDTVMTSHTVFPPVQYYLDHVLNKQGILYNNSIWANSQLVSVQSEQTDNNS